MTIAESLTQSETTNIASPPEDNAIVLQEELDRVLALVNERVASQKFPISTYRFQFNSQMTFRQATEMVPYLTALGITDVYASPLLRARKGSLHGYDVVRHDELNPEIGTSEEFETFTQQLQQFSLGLILDVVPNHMAASPTENGWWWDVLENGPSSPYANYFDIDWNPVKLDLANKLLLPVLGDQFGTTLEEGQLVVRVGNGQFWLEYFQQKFPLAPQTYGMILGNRLDDLRAALGAEHPDVNELLSILTAIGNLPPNNETAPVRVKELHREKEVIKRRLQALMEGSVAAAEFVQENVNQINGRKGEPNSFDLLDQLLQQQPYRLAYWRVASDEINYRRFFDVNELAAICMERPEVFDATHRLVFDLIDRGQVQGLRIDHPDGLFDPPGYLRQLQEKRFLQIVREVGKSEGLENTNWPETEANLLQLWRTVGCLPGAPLSRLLYVVVEKILEHGEEVPGDWLMHGTVGYEFLIALNGLFVNPAGTKTCTTTYSRMTGNSMDVAEIYYRCKRLIVRRSMSSELTFLAHRLDRISERNRKTRDFTLNSLLHALEEVISCFEVYRTYVRPDRILERDRRYIEAAVTAATRRNPATSSSLFAFIHELLLLNFREEADEQERTEIREFVGKFQQLTGPIMAKALEDTAFYRFNRLVSLNEVGGQPQHFGESKEAFHKLNAGRLPQLSRGLSSTSTHDTKRSEDTRARISVLSEVSREWRAQVMRWVKQNQKLKIQVDGEPAPSRSDEYLLYQTMIGIWPGNIPTGKELEVFVARVQQYMNKVAHEAKLHTSWTNPNLPYEQALSAFVENLFKAQGARSFAFSLNEFSNRVAEHGMWNSLSQLALKIASPGVPDFFQGTELWTLALVDPDNRQPFDIALRLTQLEELTKRMPEFQGMPAECDAIADWISSIESGQANCAAMESLLKELLKSRSDGRIKLFTTVLGLRLRQKFSELFTSGEYFPVSATGQFQNQLVAFVRREKSNRLLVVVPRWTVDVCGFGGPPPLGSRWGNTVMNIAEDVASNQWTDLFTGRTHVPDSSGLNVADVLRDWPVALLLGKAE